MIPTAALSLVMEVRRTQKRRTLGRDGLSTQRIVFFKDVFAPKLANRRVIYWLENGIGEERDEIKYPQSIETTEKYYQHNEYLAR